MKTHTGKIPSTVLLMSPTAAIVAVSGCAFGLIGAGAGAGLGAAIGLTVKPVEIYMPQGF